MRRIFTRLMVGISVCGMLAACSTDDYDFSGNNPELNKGELSAAPYEKYALCLEPTGAEIDGKTVNYIELSASGLYYVTFVGNEVSYRPQSFRKIKAETRDWLPYETVICGNFSVLDDGSYRLEGFGDMTINPNGTVDITLESGSTYVWPVTEVKKIDNISINSRLCRTWNLIDGRIDFLDSEMKVIYSLPVSQEVMSQDYIYAVTFTSSGRFYRKDYEDDYWYGGNWRWSDLSAQLIQANSDDPEDGAGIFQVLFNNNMMQVMNPWAFENGEEARWEFSNIPGFDNIPVATRYAREYINMKAMN